MSASPNDGSGLEYMVVGLSALWFVFGTAFATSVFFILMCGYLAFVVADYSSKKGPRR